MFKEFGQGDSVVELVDTASEQERSLSPEAHDKVMEKVRDIETPGTAYTFIVNDAPLSGILKNGLLGQTRDADNDPSKLVKDSASWTKSVRTPVGYHQQVPDHSVYFNLTGRTHPADDLEFNIISDRRAKGISFKRIPSMVTNAWSVRNTSTLGIMFNIEGFDEVQPGDRDSKQKGHSFRVNSKSSAYYLDIPPATDKEAQIRHEAEALGGKAGEKLLKEKFDVYRIEEGLPSNGSEYGFKLTPRVAPRALTGIMVKPENFRQMEDTIETGVMSGDLKEQMRTQAREAAQIMMETYAGKDELLLPIYDFMGNLMWPEEISYEELVANIQPSKEKAA